MNAVYGNPKKGQSIPYVKSAGNHAAQEVQNIALRSAGGWVRRLPDVKISAIGEKIAFPTAVIRQILDKGKLTR